MKAPESSTSESRTEPPPSGGRGGHALLTTAQLAEYLQVPLPSLHQWRHKGTGPRGLKVGRHVRYRIADVDRWLDARGEDSEVLA